jgi:hypothetical protein
MSHTTVIFSRRNVSVSHTTVIFSRRTPFKDINERLDEWEICEAKRRDERNSN